ncbi:hypothetical protein ACFL36_06130 [Thermodesulfobacteriota bacterium]
MYLFRKSVICFASLLFLGMIFTIYSLAEEIVSGIQPNTVNDYQKKITLAPPKNLVFSDTPLPVLRWESSNSFPTKYAVISKIKGKKGSDTFFTGRYQTHFNVFKGNLTRRTKGTTHIYRVKAYWDEKTSFNNGLGYNKISSLPSNEVYFINTGSKYDNAEPLSTIVKNFKGKAEGGDIILTWDKYPYEIRRYGGNRPEPEILNYKIYYGNRNRFYTQTILIPEDRTDHVLKGANMSIGHYFVITAISKSGYESEYSKQIVIKQPSSPPRDFSITSVGTDAKSGESTIKFRWTPSTSIEVEYYRLHVGPIVAIAPSTVAIIPKTLTEYTFTKILKKGNYQARLSLVDEANLVSYAPENLSFSIPFKDTEPPILNILIKNNREDCRETTQQQFNISGTVKDSLGVENISWHNFTAGESGEATGINNWRINGIGLIEGNNKITITAKDASGNISEKHVCVVYKRPSLKTFKNPFGFSVVKYSKEKKSKVRSSALEQKSIRARSIMYETSVEVKNVNPSSPAYKSGLKEGMILISINWQYDGFPPYPYSKDGSYSINTVDSFTQISSKIPIGSAVGLGILKEIDKTILGPEGPVQERSWIRDSVSFKYVPLMNAEKNTIDGTEKNSVSDLSEYIKKLKSARDQYKNETASIQKNTHGLPLEELVQKLSETQKRYRDFLQSDEIKKIRGLLIDKFIVASPIAQKILIKTISKTVENEEQLVYDLIGATLTGGGALSATLTWNAFDATVETLHEEGYISNEEVQIMFATQKIIAALNGVNNAYDAISVLQNLQKTHNTMVDIGIIDSDKIGMELVVRLKAEDLETPLKIVLNSNTQSTKIDPTSGPRIPGSPVIITK